MLVKTPTLSWMENYREAVNTDAEMEVIGEWFSNDFHKFHSKVLIF